jgi:hypothetical protein
MFLRAPENDTSFTPEEFDDEGAGAFLANLTGEPEEPKEKPEEGASEGEPGEGQGEPEVGSEKPAEGQEEQPDDEGEVELKFGEEARKVSVKEIKALIESKASLTTRSESITASERAAAERTQRAELALTKMVEKAKAAFEPYAKLNFLVLAKELDTATLEQVQKDAQAAYAAVQFYETELNDLTQKAHADAQAANQRAATEALRVINDKTSSSHIPNFSKDTYQSMVDFAAKQGMNRNVVLGLTDPAALKLIHMAMQHAKGQTATASKVAKVVQKPTKVLKPSAASASASTSKKSTDAIARLRRTGSVDDAADAFLAGFGRDND